MGSANTRFFPAEEQKRLRDLHEENVARVAEMKRRAEAAAPSKPTSGMLSGSNYLSRPTASDDGSGFAIGLATGVPIPLTPSAMAGAAVHHSLSDTSSCSSSSSYDSGSSSSDSGSSSSSCD